MLMLSCAPVCNDVQDFNPVPSTDVLWVLKDFSEIPFEVDISSFIDVVDSMALSHMRLYSYDPETDTILPLK